MELIVASELKEEFYKYLKSKGHQLFQLDRESVVYSSISNHPDIFTFAYKGTLVYAPCKASIFKDKSISIQGENKLKKKYPGTIYYNVSVVGEYAIHNDEYTDPIIKKLIQDKKWISVKQGYTKCNTVIVDDMSIITSDDGIYNALKATSLEVLLIDSGHIKLEGVDHGFIGGTSLSLEDEIIFYGDITKHPSYQEIESFIKERKKKIKYFSFPLEDIGSVIKVR